MLGPEHSTRARLARATPLLSGAALGVVLATALAARAADAQGASPSLTIDVGDCLSLESPGKRFDCYERHVEAAKAANPPAADAAVQPGVVTNAPAPEPASPSTAAATAASAAALSAPPTASPSTAAAAAASGAAEIVATVAELHESGPNVWLITLDNGQVWKQDVPQRFALKAGQRVTLHQSRWGSSYRLSADGLNGFIQVERAR
jgi:hypothetical protein